jgi:Fe2+ transport system protein FeoA
MGRAASSGFSFRDGDRTRRFSAWVRRKIRLFREITVATQSQLTYFSAHVNDTSVNASASGAEPLHPLSAVSAGVSVRIKQLSASPEVSQRLRELGFCEEQRIKLLSRNPNLICQVCNARLGLSTQLASLIWVEQVKPKRLAA